MTDKNVIGIGASDYIAMVGKGLSGAIPVVGPMVAELLGVFIPNQRADRFEKMLVTLEAKVNELGIDRLILGQRFTRPEYRDIFEEGATQAVRAFSKERIHHIANILADGLAQEELEYLKTKKLLQLLSQVSDAEIIYLYFYYLVQESEPEQHQEFWRKHQALLEPADNSLGLPVENHERHDIQESYVENLVNLRLLERSASSVPSATIMGRLFVKAIGCSEAYSDKQL